MHPPRVPPVVKRVSGSFWASCNHAFTGILYATRSQRNMRIHLFVAALVLVATLYLRLERAYVALLVVAIVLVIGSELINTAIEAVVDLLTVVHHPLAKVAKDAAAGAVLVASAGAAIIGYLAFYEGVTAAGARVGSAVASLPRNFVIVAIVLTGIGTIFAKAYAGRHGQPLRGGAISGHSAVAFSGATALALLTPDLLLG
ncbi:MAG: diacylglycerol kinase, partial [Candidatus Eremiobacteraeota bacterium]|nr:diacylglycerol kinase [Candidatus Eremiobacteraeota bacterium]